MSTEHDVAQQPRRVRVLRLVPLLLLVTFVAGTSVVGLTVRGDRPAIRPEAPVVAAAVAARPQDPLADRRVLPRRCTPYAPLARGAGRWDSPRRPALDAAFLERMAQEQPAYVRGKQGWLFWNDWQVENFSQAVGRTRLSGSALAGWSRYLARLQRTADKVGSRLVVVPAPAKWDVYPQRLPGWAQRMRGATSFDTLLATQPELPLVDVRSALRRAAGRNDTYEPLDSHWTPYGAWVAWRSIASCLRVADDIPVRAPTLDGVTATESGNEFSPWGIVAPSTPTRTEPVWSRAHPATTYTSMTDGAEDTRPDGDVVLPELMPVRTETPGAQSDDSALVLRDSTGSAISPLLSDAFATTYQYSHDIAPGHTGPRAAQLIKRLRPDVTLLVFTERYLGYPPPT